MNELLWFVCGLAVGILPLIIVLVVIPRKRENVNVFNTDDISELIGKIQHVTSVNVDTAERKIIQLKSTIRSANAEYMKLNEAISDAKNLFSKHMSSAFKGEEKNNIEIEDRTLSTNQGFGLKENLNTKPFTREEKMVDSKGEEKNSIEIEGDTLSANQGFGLKGKISAKPLTKEEKVIDLKGKNWSVERIAESLNMGINEVKLIVDLDSRMNKSQK